MSRNVSSTKSLYQKHFDVRSVFFYMLVIACLLSALLIFAFWVEGWTLWLLGFLIIAAWMPLVFSTMRTIYQQHPWLALLYLLVVAQTAHTIEHLAQMVELHVS